MRVSLYVLLTLLTHLNCFKVEVKIKEGFLFGLRETTVFDQKLYYAFYGVPYAKAPIGKLRFKNPVPLKKFPKPFDASTEYHGACAQAHIVHKHALYGYEDCLHLNIYTPYIPKYINGNLKPILVWIHGYAFASSFSHVYGPDFLIENDIIFISLTHRIGPFGFLRVNDTDDNINMGLRDIVTGLKWIRSNAKYFGGDKDKITLMGSGSGGTFALLLMLTKHRKLFEKLIIHSGSMFSPSLFENINILQRFKLQNELKTAGYNNYMKAPAHAIVTAANKVISTWDVINSQRPIIPFPPVIGERSIVTKSHFEDYENKEKDYFNIPILVGFTTQESISETIPFIHNQSYLKALGAYFKYMVPFSSGCRYNFTNKIYTFVSNKIIKRYFKNYPDITLEEFLKYVSDVHKYPIYKFIKTHIKYNNRKLFVYKFNYDGKFNAVKSTSLAGIKTRVKGAAQGDELCYILKCEPLWENYVKIKSESDNRDRTFIKQIALMWSNFVKFGNPTPANFNGNFTWAPMTTTEDSLLFIGKRSMLTDSKPETKMYKFWNKLYNYYYSPELCNHRHDEL